MNGFIKKLSSKSNNFSALILGCGRSGTSIFGELFEHIEQYSYHSEPYFDVLYDIDFRTPTVIKVPKESDDFVATPGLSFPLDALLEVMPETSKIYWQVRHPLDAISSLKIGISNNWGHHPRPPDWRQWLSLSLVQRCAHHWAYINTAGYQQVKEIAKVCRFESMLTDPFEFAKEICDDLRIEVEGAKKQLSEWSDRVQDTNNEKFIEAKTSRPYSRPDHKKKVGRWKENLSSEELLQILPIVRQASEPFGYELPDM